MKLYNTGAKLYVAEAGAIRTSRSEISYLKVMRFLQSQFPEHHVNDFTTEDLTAFCLSNGAAPSTIKQRKAHVRSTFAWLCWKGLCDTDPSADLKFTVRPGRGQVRSGRWLSEPEVKAVYAGFDLSTQIGRRDRLIFLFGVSTGLRLMELSGLTWGSFTNDLSTFTVHGKGDKIVTVKVPRQLHLELVAWHRERWVGGSAVFPSFRMVFDPKTHKRKHVVNWDTPLGDNGIRFVVRGAGVRAGIKLNPHDLRRSFAGLLEAKGLGLRDIQRAMRHENLATTDKYLDKNPARLAEIMDGLEFNL